MTLQSAFMDLLGPPTAIQVLDYMIDNYALEYDIYDVMAGCGICRSSAYKVLKRFKAFGIARTTLSGRKLMYKLNKDSEIVSKLRELDSCITKDWTERNVKEE